MLACRWQGFVGRSRGAGGRTSARVKGMRRYAGCPGQVAILFAGDRRRHHVAEEAHSCALTRMRETGVAKVEVVTCRGRGGPERCRSLDGEG